MYFVFLVCCIGLILSTIYDTCPVNRVENEGYPSGLGILENSLTFKDGMVKFVAEFECWNDMDYRISPLEYEDSESVLTFKSGQTKSYWTETIVNGLIRVEMNLPFDIFLSAVGNGVDEGGDEYYKFHSTSFVTRIEAVVEIEMEGRSATETVAQARKDAPKTKFQVAIVDERRITTIQSAEVITGLIVKTKVKDRVNGCEVEITHPISEMLVYIPHWQMSEGWQESLVMMIFPRGEIFENYVMDLLHREGFPGMWHADELTMAEVQSKFDWDRFGDFSNFTTKYFYHELFPPNCQRHLDLVVNIFMEAQHPHLNDESFDFRMFMQTLDVCGNDGYNDLVLESYCGEDTAARPNEERTFI